MGLDSLAGFARQTGRMPDALQLRLLPRDRRSVLMAIAASAAVVLYIVLLDLLFRGELSHDYIAYFTGPNLLPRIAFMAIAAAAEEAEFRLLLMSALVFVLMRVLERNSASVIAIALSQAANVFWRLPPDMPMAYDLLRYYVPGLVWGYVYWKNGFTSALLAHAGAHVLLQPLLLVIL